MKPRWLGITLIILLGLPASFALAAFVVGPHYRLTCAGLTLALHLQVLQLIDEEEASPWFVLIPATLLWPITVLEMLCKQNPNQKTK